MMQIMLKPRSVVRTLPVVPAPVSIHTDAGDAAAAAPIAEYKKLLATMDAHAEILEHAIELRTRSMRAAVSSAVIEDDERRELDILNTHLTNLRRHRASLLAATTAYSDLQALVDTAATVVRSHLTKAHDEPVDGAYCDYAAYLAARQRLVELMVERDSMFEAVGKVAVEVMRGEEEMARVIYACRREMGRDGTGKAGIRGRRVSRGEGIEPPPPYRDRDVWKLEGES